MPALLIATGSGWLFALNAWMAWLVAINLVTLLTYGYDKAIAGSGKMRVPETVLLGLGLLGGTLAALAAMQLFRHKTIKRTFQKKFWLVTAAQLAAVLLYFLLLRPLLT
ncbi:MAG: DUF1294 domain-containing protein [Anaerolineaceae bacterium]|nr:DUF1294 domain-containing protein [Anaerolineaceae bacterium]